MLMPPENVLLFGVMENARYGPPGTKRGTEYNP